MLMQKQQCSTVEKLVKGKKKSKIIKKSSLTDTINDKLEDEGSSDRKKRVLKKIVEKKIIIKEASDRMIGTKGKVLNSDKSVVNLELTDKRLPSLRVSSVENHIPKKLVSNSKIVAPSEVVRAKESPPDRSKLDISKSCSSVKVVLASKSVGDEKGGTITNRNKNEIKLEPVDKKPKKVIQCSDSEDTNPPSSRKKVRPKLETVVKIDHPEVTKDRKKPSSRSRTDSIQINADSPSQKQTIEKLTVNRDETNISDEDIFHLNEPSLEKFPFEKLLEDAEDAISKDEMAKEGGVKEAVSGLVGQWSEMIERQKKEHWTLLRQHVTEQQDCLTKLMEAAHLSQMKQLEGKHDKEIKEINAKQAKLSDEAIKEITNDKTLRTKGEKDRRLREKKQNNTKKFMDERKYLQMKQDREKEKLNVKHEKQKQDLMAEITVMFDAFKREEAEYDLVNKVELFA